MQGFCGDIGPGWMFKSYSAHHVNTRYRSGLRYATLFGVASIPGFVVMVSLLIDSLTS